MCKEKIDHDKLEELLSRIKISDEVMKNAAGMKMDILQDVNRRINKHSYKVKLYYLTASVAASLILFIAGTYYHNIRQADFSKDKLMTYLHEKDPDQYKEIHLITEDHQQIVENEETITHTNDGEVLIGDKQDISVSEERNETITLIVPKGKRTTVHFSDGTIAWVNPGTKLVYPKKFGKKNRDIFVDGEIYLDVMRDESRPFRIFSQPFDVKVLGTELSINTYNNGRENFVVLVKGAVEVKSHKQKIKLKPDQGFFSFQGFEKTADVDVSKYISWKEGKLTFEDEPFSEIIEKLAFYYGVDIRPDKQLENLKMAGNLNLRDSIEDIFEAFALSLPIEIRKENNIIYITSTNEMLNP